jgi:putative ABC transport system permease protein
VKTYRATVKLIGLIVWRHLFREPVRTLVTAIGVGLGVAVYVAVAVANVQVLRTFEEAVVGVAGRTTLQIRSVQSDGFAENIIRAVRYTTGVTLATPVLEIPVTWQPPSTSPVVITILGVDLLAESAIREYAITPETEDKGQGLEWERYLEPDAIFLGRALAARNGLSVGRSLEVRAEPSVRRVTMRGMLEGRGPGKSALEELAVMDIAAAQFTFERIGQLDRIDIITEPGQAVEEVASRIQSRLPAGLLVDRPDRRNAQIERMTRAFRLNVASLSAVAVLVGVFLVYNTMSFSVVRRRREIGILRSLGLLPAGIGGLFLIEGIILAILGWLIGLGGGLLFARAAVRVMAGTATDLYDLTVHPISASSAGLPLEVVAQSFVIAIGVAVLGSLRPIKEATAVVPVQALMPKGYEHSGRVGILPTLGKSFALLAAAVLAALPGPIHGVPVFGYLSAFLLIMAFALVSPVILRAFGPCIRMWLPRRVGYLPYIAAGELERAPVRNAVAVSALMMGLALMIGMGILIHSFRMTVEMWLDQTVKADVIVAPPTWLGGGPRSSLHASVRSRLVDLPGVVAVDAYRDIRMEFRDRQVSLVARDLLLHAQHSRYLFLHGDSSKVLADAVRQHQVLVSETLAMGFKLRPGDSITLSTPEGPAAFTIAGVFYDYATDGGKIVMDQALYQRVWQDRSLSVVPLYLGHGVDPESIRREVTQRLGGQPPVMVVTNQELKREVLRIFDQTFAVTYALELIAVLVALLGIVNALLSGILERQGELAVLRAIGATPRQVGRIILWESGMIGAAGAVLGVAAGFLLSALLIEVINKQSFGWSIAFHPSGTGLVMAVALALVTTVVAGYGPARRAASLPVAESLHYE